MEAVIGVNGQGFLNRTCKMQRKDKCKALIRFVDR